MKNYLHFLNLVRHFIDKCRKYYIDYGKTQLVKDFAVVKKMVKKYTPKNIAHLDNVETKDTYKDIQSNHCVVNSHFGDHIPNVELGDTTIILELSPFEEENNDKNYEETSYLNHRIGHD